MPSNNINSLAAVSKWKQFSQGRQSSGNFGCHPPRPSLSRMLRYIVVPECGRMVIYCCHESNLGRFSGGMLCMFHQQWTTESSMRFRVTPQSSLLPGTIEAIEIG
jgi:hypothetical protein